MPTVGLATFLSKFGQLLSKTGVANIRNPPLRDTPADYCAYVLKLFVCGHFMSCTLEVKSKDGLNQGHVEFFPTTTRSIISPLLNVYSHQNWQGGDLP